VSAIKHGVAAFFGLVLGCIAVPAWAGSRAPLSDSELGAVRGGYVNVGGLTFDFGATLRTYVDGSLALQTTLTLNDQGTATTQIISDPSALSLQGAPAFGLNVGPSIGPGIVIPGAAGGGTVIIQNLSDSQIRNMVVNNAQDRTIVQDTALNFVIPNLSQLQQSMALQQVQSGLEEAIGSALRASSH
jgi:hypothetical protein